MRADEAFFRFLRLETEDFDLLDRYRAVLQQGAELFARSFYEYLFGAPETAAILAGRNLAALLEGQATHFERLLAERFAPEYRAAIQRVGQIHQRLGIAPAWIAGSYSLYKEHLEQRTNAPDVPPEDRAPLRRVMSKIVFADLGLQLQGYARAQSQEDATRAALTRVLIDTVLSERSTGTWDSLLRRMCQGLVSEDTHILAAWGASLEAGRDGLTLACFADGGSGEGPTCIPRQPDHPCWQALAAGEPVVVPATDAATLGLPGGVLPPGSQEVGFIPFGRSHAGYAGVGIVVADYVNYFARIGLDHFKAFSHFGDLAMTMRDQSLRDPLTGLPNRVLFHDRMNHALAGAGRRERLVAVGVLDLDGFKAVNDQFGHAAGDALLRQAVGRLRGAMRPMDTLARLGGDEFGLLLEGLENVFQLETLGERFLEAVRDPFEVEGRIVRVSASIGFTLHPLDDGDGETLLRHADMAMYSSKSAGRDKATVYSAAMSAEASRHARMTGELRSAIEREELVLHFQPQVDMATGDVVGAEALLRWSHPDRGMLLPGDFLDGVEGGPLLRRIGRHVLDQALRQAASWQAQGVPLRVAVNVGARHLLMPQFIDDLRESLARHAVGAHLLAIEITENTPIVDLASARDALAACRRLGVTVILDDFGTGNAPLSHLQALPADVIKIDRGFVRDILRNPKDRAIVAGVVTSAQLLGLGIVAEGVEDEEQGDLLLKLGCRLAQGYAIARPMPGPAIPEWIRAYTGLASWRAWAGRPWRPADYGALMAAFPASLPRAGAIAHP